MLKKRVIKKQKNTSTGFQPQTQTNFVILGPNINSTETTESISPTEVTATSIPTRPTLISGITILLQRPTETARSNSDFRNDPKSSEKFRSQDTSVGTTSQQLIH